LLTGPPDAVETRTAGTADESPAAEEAGGTTALPGQPAQVILDRPQAAAGLTVTGDAGAPPMASTAEPTANMTKALAVCWMPPSGGMPRPYPTPAAEGFPPANTWDRPVPSTAPLSASTRPETTSASTTGYARAPATTTVQADSE